MQKLLRTLAMAAVLVAALLLAHAASAACPENKATKDKVLSDLGSMKADTGWENTVVSAYEGDQVHEISVAYLAQPMVFINPGTRIAILASLDSIVVRSSGHPNALIIWFDSGSCFIGMGPMPAETWHTLENKLRGTGL